jgi:hypothetical protein
VTARPPRGRAHALGLMILKFFEIVQHTIHPEMVSTGKIIDNSPDLFGQRSAGGN